MSEIRFGRAVVADDLPTDHTNPGYTVYRVAIDDDEKAVAAVRLLPSVTTHNVWVVSKLPESRFNGNYTPGKAEYWFTTKERPTPKSVLED
jgi:hypothetical protein